MNNTINVTKSSMPAYEEYCEEIRELWDSHWLTNMGTKHQQLQAELAEYLHTSHVTLYTNGHLALEHIIAAMNFPARSEVITTPFTFASTTHAIVRNGLVPVFCDVNDVDYTIDVRKIESLITEKTVAIVPVHVYGNLCDVEGIKQIADKYNLKVIYDAAHAFGVTYKGVSSANFGDASMFSFHATKVFNTIEGGAVCYADGALTSRLNAIKNFGMIGSEDCEYIGSNAKMNEFQAVMGICNLRHLKQEIAKRKQVADRYRERLENIEGICLNPIQKNVQSNYAYFPVFFDEVIFGASRDEVKDTLAEEGIIARKYFYPLTNAFTCYQSADVLERKATPIADKLAKSVLTLPLYADLSMEDVDKICDLICQIRARDL